MKLLLDEMHAPAVAGSLCKQGHDVVAIAADPALKSLTDPDVLALAVTQERALVTENISDFRPLADQCSTAGRRHLGIVYTSPIQFPRSSLAYPGSLIKALSALLASPPPITQHDSWEWWLQPSTGR